MCRTDLGAGINEEIRKDENEFNFKFELHNVKCSGCNKKPILGQIYHCLMCENVNICGLCYDNFAHAQHTKFITKKRTNDEWSVPLDSDRMKLIQ